MVVAPCVDRLNVYPFIHWWTLGSPFIFCLLRLIRLWTCMYKYFLEHLCSVCSICPRNAHGNAVIEREFFLNVLRKGCPLSWRPTSSHSYQQRSRDLVSALLAKTCYFHLEKLKHRLLFVLGVTILTALWWHLWFPWVLISEEWTSSHAFIFCVSSSLENLPFLFFDYVLDNFFFIWDKVLLCNSSWPKTLCIDQAVLKLREIH